MRFLCKYEKGCFFMERPVTTLFLLQSVDGKISTGSSDSLDADKDFAIISGIKEGLHQYYEIEQTTDLWSLCTGKTQAKIGVNENQLEDSTVIGINFVAVDNWNLTKHGVEYLCSRYSSVFIVTTNHRHPARSVACENLEILSYDSLCLAGVLRDLYSLYGCERITLQSGGTLNGLLLREKVIDFVDVVIAPVLVGGRDTPTLIDGQSLTNPRELDKLGVLQLEKASALEDSFVRLRYKVIS